MLNPLAPMRRVLLAVLILVAATAAVLLLGQYTRAASLLVLGAEVEGWPRTFVRLHAGPVVEEMLEVPSRDGPLRTRAYRPVGRTGRTVLLITGIHPAGIDDPRLRHFARSLAAVGLVVLTPEVPPLFRFEISPAATTLIEEVTRWAASDADLAPDGRVGLAGISFSGGLAVVAAGRDTVADRVAFVLSVGGHGDLLRTLDELAGGVLTGAGEPEANTFGLTMVLASVADQVVPREQVPAVRAWARTFLEAAHRPVTDPARMAGFEEAERLAAALPEPAATLVWQVRTEDTAALRPRLFEPVRALGADPALSPERAPPPEAPVYLLHGDRDEVIPPGESLHLARHLERATRVRVLLTPILTHADIEEPPAPADAWVLVRFMAEILRR